MNALGFTNKLSGCIKSFFHQCCEHSSNCGEALENRHMSNVQVYICDWCLTLSLETDEFSYSQELCVTQEEIVELHFEVI